MTKVKTTSKHILAGLYAYWRYKKQFVCADEVLTCEGIADLVVDTGGFLYEIEIKTSKSDLVQGEKRKTKHQWHKEALTNEKKRKSIPNQFYVCVPTNLIPAAEEWVKNTNPNYGILEFMPDCLRRWEDMIRVAKRAKFLHQDKITDRKRELILRRLCSARASSIIGYGDELYERDEPEYQI